MNSYCAKMNTINCSIADNGRRRMKGSMRANQSEYSKEKKNIHPV